MEAVNLHIHHLLKILLELSLVSQCLIVLFIYLFVFRKKKGTFKDSSLAAVLRVIHRKSEAL